MLTIIALSIFAVLSVAHLVSRPRQVTIALRAMAVAAIGVSLYAIFGGCFSRCWLSLCEGTARSKPFVWHFDQSLVIAQSVL